MTIREKARKEAQEYIEDVVKVDRKGARPAKSRYDDAVRESAAAFERLMATRRRAGKVRPK